MKKGKKILSLGLATVMAFSVGASAFAASAAEEPVYKPVYNDKVTEEKIDTFITTADGLLDSMVWSNYGGTIMGALFGVFPGLGGDFATAEFYQKIDSDLFKDLASPVTADSMKAYLADHPVTVAASADIVASLEKVLPAALTPLMTMTLGDFGVEGSLAETTVAQLIALVLLFAQPVIEGVDDLVLALGIDRGEKPLITLLAELTNNSADPTLLAGSVNELSAYVMSIVKALMPNTVDKVLDLVKTYSTNQADVLTALDKIVTNLNTTLGALGGFGVTLPATITGAITWIQTLLADYAVETGKQLPVLDENGDPTVDEEGNAITTPEKVLDLDSLINYFLGGVNALDGAIVIPDLSATAFIMTDKAVADGKDPQIKLSSVNDLIASVADADCDSSADVLMVVFSYLQANVLDDAANYAAVKELLGGLGDTGEMIGNVLDSLKGDTTLDTVNNVLVLLGINEDAETDSVPGGDADNDNPPTGDAAMSVAVFAAATAAAAVFMLRRKK